MNPTRPRWTFIPLVSLWVAGAACFVPDASAKSPDQIKLGKQLFEHDWSPSNPKFGSDGLGPLFNAKSCVTCHNQGGSGGSGEAPFNAVSIGIERMSITGGRVNQDLVARMLRQFHPGFVQPGGAIINTWALPHHGGSSDLSEGRNALRSNVPAVFSQDGGPEDAVEVRSCNASPILSRLSDGKYETEIQARLFQRNTTALFGAGLIDQVADREIEAVFRTQKRHPEISGRPSTLTDGRIGKFGWRANVATLLEFNDQACANEVGLETERKPQPSDPTVPSYRNPKHDISDDQIMSINAFVASLPAPTRRVPQDTAARLEVRRGEKKFASVGCAVCHVPNLGPAKGIFSDLLLHDMGDELYDLNHAEPYIRRIKPVTRVRSLSSIRAEERRRAAASYYGGTTEITVASASSPVTRTTSSVRGDYEFVSPRQPSPISRTRLSQTPIHDPFFFSREEPVERNDLVEQRFVEVHVEPTNFNQEWRTPPLWGLRDSAPYMHDGRADTVLEAISMHDGESAGTRDRFLSLPLADRHAILAFLDTLVAPRQVPAEPL